MLFLPSKKKMQVTIITRSPEEVIHTIQKSLRRGITIINEAEGAYKHDKQTVLLTVVTRFELPMLRSAMKEADPKAFVSIAENVQILGRFMKKNYRRAWIKAFRDEMLFSFCKINFLENRVFLLAFLLLYLVNYEEMGHYFLMVPH